ALINLDVATRAPRRGRPIGRPTDRRAIHLRRSIAGVAPQPPGIPPLLSDFVFFVSFVAYSSWYPIRPANQPPNSQTSNSTFNVRSTDMPKKETTYDEAQIAERLRDLPGWYLEDGWIRRVYKTDGWPTTLMLVNAIGYLSEAAYHHPDLSVTWGRITVKLSTHSAGGITDKDFALARKIEDAVLWRPAAGEALEGTPNKFVRSGDPR